MKEATRIAFIGLQTLVIKEVTRFFRIWMQSLLPPAMTMTLYFVIFGRVVGAHIQSVSGHTYMQYIMPGLVMMSLMTNAYANTASSFFGAKFNHSIEEIIVSPMPSIIILLGFMTGGVLRGVVVAIIVTAISLFFTHLPVHNFGLVILIVLLCAMLFSLAGLVNAIFAKKFDDIAFVPSFILTPLTYLGGVFYSINQLSGFWHDVSLINPIFYMIDTFRYAVLGVSDLDISIGLMLLASLFALLFGVSWQLLERGVGIKA